MLTSFKAPTSLSTLLCSETVRPVILKLFLVPSALLKYGEVLVP